MDKFLTKINSFLTAALNFPRAFSAVQVLSAPWPIRTELHGDLSSFPDTWNKHQHHWLPSKSKLK